MTSFYYYDQNPSGFCFLVQSRAFVIQTSLRLQNIKYERKNEKDSSCSSKMTPSCKCPIQRHTHCYFIACRLRSKNERRNTATKVWENPTWWFQILTIDCFLFKRVNKQLTQKWFNACILSQQYKIMLLSYSLEVYQKIFSIVREC